MGIVPLKKVSQTNTGRQSDSITSTADVAGTLCLVHRRDSTNFLSGEPWFIGSGEHWFIAGKRNICRHFMTSNPGGHSHGTFTEALLKVTTQKYSISSYVPSGAYSL